MSMRWSDELVTRRYRQGWSQTWIAEAQGVARGTVRRVLLRHGVALRTTPGPVTAYPGQRSWWVARLEPVRVDGTWRRVTVAELCTQFGVSRTVILRRLDRFDIPRHLIAADPPPEPGCTAAELEAWVARSTRPEQHCRRWIFTRASAGREPVTHQGGKRTGVARLVCCPGRVWPDHGAVAAGAGSGLARFTRYRGG